MKAVLCLLLLFVLTPGFSQPGTGMSYRRQAVALFEKEKFKEAGHYADSALTVAMADGNADSITLAYQLLSKIHFARKEYSQAMDDLSIGFRYHDSVRTSVLVEVQGFLMDTLRQARAAYRKDSLAMAAAISNLEERLRSSEKNSMLIMYGTVALGLIIILSLYRRGRQIDSRLTAANANIAHLQSFKEKLFTVLSYDLKNSLTAFEKLTSTLGARMKTLSHDETVLFLTSLNATAGDLKSTLDNVVHWVGYEAKSKPFQPTLFDCKILVERTMTKFAQAMSARKLTPDIFIPNHQTVFADEEMIGIILENLIANAVQFTAAGGTITCFSGRKDDLVTIGVKDSGIGISEADVNKLFNPSEDFHSIGKPNNKGVGVGLILSKELVERNGGRMYVESTVGQGSTFYFTLPERNQN